MEISLEVKLCECGCGMPTPVAKQNHKKYGWVKGRPMKFIHGHNSKGKNHNNWKGGITSDGRGYTLIWHKNHPCADSKGYIRKSRLIAEKALGKLLPSNVIIHHVNEKINDDENSNLVVCENQAYHFLLHIRKRAYDACGHANWRKCCYCKEYDDPKNLYISPTGKAAYHRECQREYERKR